MKTAAIALLPIMVLSILLTHVRRHWQAEIASLVDFHATVYGFPVPVASRVPIYIRIAKTVGQHQPLCQSY